jgi:DNA-binding beta-propeller fold protein YncE
MALLAFVAVGCGAAGAGQQARLLRVDGPLKEPAWVPNDALLALSEDGRRVERIDFGASGSGRVLSSKLKDLGENLALNPREPGRAYVARPESGRISELNTDTLRVVGGYDTGDEPHYVTVNAQPELLFALSEDGTEVSGVDLATSQELPTLHVDGDPQTLIEAPEKGFDPALWVAGSDGAAYYGGDPLQSMTRDPQEVKNFAVDTESAQRIYLAEGSRLTALEGDPQQQLKGDLEVMASRNLGETVEAVTSDALYVYAATQDRLIVMLRETLKIVEMVDLRGKFERKGLQPTGISGITAGESSGGVYLTLEGEPYVMSISKP